jgi:hypothetical protein
MYSSEKKDVWWAVETNGPGLALFDLLVEVHDLGNPFLMPIYDTVKESVSYRKGWWTSVSSRRALVGGLKEWLSEGQGWCDTRCAREMTTFVIDKQGKACAKEGANDDEVMCLGIALQVDRMAPDDLVYRAEAKDIETFKKEVTSVRKKEEVTSLEERCLLHATAKQAQRQLNLVHLTDSMFEQVQLMMEEY